MVRFVEMRVVDKEVPLNGRPDIIRIDRSIVDMETRLLHIVEDVLESLDESEIRVKVMSKMLVGSLEIELDSSIADELLMVYRFRLIVPGYNWQVVIAEGRELNIQINGINYMENSQFVDWVKRMMK